MNHKLAEAKIQREKLQRRVLIHQYGIILTLTGAALFAVGGFSNNASPSLGGSVLLVWGFIYWFLLNRGHTLTGKDWEEFWGIR